MAKARASPGSQGLGPASAALSGALARSKIRSAAMETQPMPVWRADVTGHSSVSIIMPGSVIGLYIYVVLIKSSYQPFYY